MWSEMSFAKEFYIWTVNFEITNNMAIDYKVQQSPFPELWEKIN